MSALLSFFETDFLNPLLEAALHFAAYFGKIDVVTFLLEAGATASLATGTGKTALQAVSFSPAWANQNTFQASKIILLSSIIQDCIVVRFLG